MNVPLRRPHAPFSARRTASMCTSLPLGARATCTSKPGACRADVARADMHALSWRHLHAFAGTRDDDDDPLHHYHDFFLRRRRLLAYSKVLVSACHLVLRTLAPLRNSIPIFPPKSPTAMHLSSPMQRHANFLLPSS